MSGCRRRDGGQQRQDECNRQKYEARHEHTIDGRRLGGDSNLGAQAGAASVDRMSKATYGAS
jgi:hypothetical protein